ncbi:glycoside hydrolase family 26 protein [Thermomonospora sp. CIF 1]|uniref:glycoside hydrolase family 26 protein n=1 Tax=Thermomonospora sp. CIF 1 TaxID=1916083 RepID=UPI000A52C0FD|nr:glycosyl hydrolase [Thermomonospora sp. CIF 1]PKK12727.1 MAG: beta-mannanase [Thermomonospora sp. CIF 1]
MSPLIRTRPRIVLSALLAVLLPAGTTACTAEQSSAPRAPRTQISVGTPFTPYDIRPLLKPRKKYIGVAIDGVSRSIAPVAAFNRGIGKKVNMVTIYAAVSDHFDSRGARRIWRAGAIPLIMWEPFSPSLATIARGAIDDHLRQFATAVRALNIPVAISFGHEMNGFWYPWGTRKNSPADFVRAWRHIHRVFSETGTTNVIWVWNPNVINPVPRVALRPYYPGDSYVDWIGLIGYYTLTGAHTFTTLFGPTMRQVRRFSDKPFIITETASQPGPRRVRDVADLLKGVASSRDVIGFIWFNYRKRADWRLPARSPELLTFRRYVAADIFGFDPTRS